MRDAIGDERLCKTDLHLPLQAHAARSDDHIPSDAGGVGGESHYDSANVHP
jgi:hypothetical protein